MALSGSFQNFPANNFGLYCEWSATQSVTGNYSNVTLSVYLKYWSLSVGARSDSTISINGTTETYTVPAISDYSDGYKLKLLKTKTVTVYHDSDGTKTDVPLSASWRMSGTYGETPVGTITASTTIDLDAIDRTAPTVKFTSSNITAGGFKISATSSATADIWQYSTNNGTSWTQFSTTAGTSASYTVTGLSPNTTYNVKVRARKKSNYVYGTSGSSSIKTLGGAVVNSVNDVTADGATVSFVLNVTVYEASYTNTVVLKNGTTTYLTISGLSWTKGTANRTVTLTAAQRTSLLTSMASIKSFTGTFEVTTFNSTTQIGSVSSKTATVSTTSANSGPTLSDFTFEDSYSTTYNITGNNQLFIQSYSTLKVTPGTATPKNGASITNYTATCNGVSASNTTGAAITVGKVTKSGDVSVVLTVTDSRGYTASVTKAISVIAYANPKVSALTIRRTNDIEAEMQLSFNGSISPITVASTQKNALTYVRYRYKLTSASSYGSYTSILSSVTTSGTSFSYSNLELCSLDANSSYDFHIQIVDKLVTINLYYVIPQGTPLLALRKGKVGINTPTPDATLHVVGDTHIVGDTRIEGTLTPDAIDYAFEKPYFGTCATAAATAAKVVTCSDFVLKKGALIAVQFTYANTASSPSMNVNGTGAIAICGIDGTYISTNMWVAKQVVHFVYNGSWWVAIGCLYANTSRYGITKLSSSVSSTSATLAATAAAVKKAYDRSDFDEITLTTALALACGGTGATTASGARTNLGITCTSLYNGTLTTGSTTFNYGNYKAYIVMGQPTSSSSRCTFIIPKDQITTSAVSYQFADEAKGDALLQKKFTVDFLEKKMKPNEGEVPQYYVENSHPAIIEPDEWDQVQYEFARRKALGRTYSGKSSLAAKLVCEDCGGFFGSKVWHSTDKYRRTIWQCNSKFSNEERCGTPTLDTETIQRMFITAYNQLMHNRSEIVSDCESMRKMLTDFTSLDAEIERQMEETQVVAELVKAAVKENASTAQSQEAYLKKYESLTARYEAAAKELERLQAERTRLSQQDKRIACFIRTLKRQPERMDTWDDTIWTVMVEKGIVHKDGSITFIFYNGTEIKVGA